MAIFINAQTSLANCQSLGDQIRVKALRLGGGWADAREDLARMAEEWFGRDPAATRQDFKSVCAEVFRSED